MLPHLQLDRLRCPVTGGVLEWLPADRLGQLQQAVLASAVVNRAGELVTRLPEGALVCHHAGLLYPVVHGIPALVPGEAIEWGQLVGSQ